MEPDGGTKKHRPPRPPTPRRPPPPPAPKWVYAYGVLWSASLVAWMPVVMHMQSSGADSAVIQRTGLVVGALALVATLVFGAALGWSARWREIRVATFIGAGVIVVALMLAIASSGDPEAENSAGFAVVFYPMAAGAIWALLGAAAAISGWVRQSRSAQLGGPVACDDEGNQPRDQ